MGSTNVDAVVAEHVMQQANKKLCDAIRRNFEDPDQHLLWFRKSHQK